MVTPLLARAPAALALSTLLLLTAPAVADQPASIPADAAQVNQHYEAGLEATKQKQWQQARESFLRAWRLKAHYQIAANLGRAELMTGAPRDAAEHLAFFLREAPSDVSAEDRAQAQRWLAEARARIGTITVKVDPPAAQVLLDGVPVPAAGASELYIDPGPHRIEARLAGHTPVSRELELTPGQTAAAELRLMPERAPAPAPPPPPSKTPPSAPGPSAALIGVGIGAGVAVAATGAALMVMAAGKERDAEGAPNQGELLRSSGDLQSAGIAAIIGAGMLGVATAAYALSEPGPARSARGGHIRIHIALSGIGMSGSW